MMPRIDRPDAIDASLLEASARIALGLADNSPPIDLSPAGDELIERAARHRVCGLLLAGIEAGSVQIAHEIVEALTRQHVQELRRCLLAEAVLTDVTDLLDGIDAPAVVVKGVATAHLAYADPAWRVFQDVDLLVPADRLDAATRALDSAGYSRDLPPRTPSWDRRFSKDLTFLSPLGAECDLHRTLVPGAFGFWLDIEHLLEGSIEFELAGRRHRALDAPGRLLHAALALTVGEPAPRFGHILDLALTLREIHDLAPVHHLCRRSRATLPLDTAAALTEQVLRPVLGDDPALSERLGALRAASRPARIEQVAMRTYRSSGGSNTATLIGGLLGLRGVSDRAAYTHGLLRPARAYRDARRRSSRPPEWRTGARELAALVRR